jgi:oligopeptide/dipeptide ABC transporter ATP-binding protein
MVDSEALLKIAGLKTHFFTERGVARAVDGVNLEVSRGQTVALVGESGCGKTVTALSIMRLVPDPPGEIVAGSVIFDGRDLLTLPERDMRKVRGKEIAMIFQEPMSSLNPVFRVGDQVAEAILLHQRVGKKEARERTIELFDKVGIPAPEERVDEYPHQMSGGMCQRVMIAMALSCNPSLLIADEPTTALDVTIQAQILALLGQLQKESHMSVLLITHDLGIVAQTTDYVAVMYASKIVEWGLCTELFREPLHPYTVGLFRSLPALQGERKRLRVIPGNVPSPLRFPSGCKFHPRCPIAEEKCAADEPELQDIVNGRRAACWFAGKEKL